MIVSFLKWLEGFFKEDNGSLSSMRLVMVFSVLGIVPLFIVACAFWHPLTELATHVFAFAASIVGLKTVQKTQENKPE